MYSTINNIPKELIDFLLVTLFSLIIGLAQRRLHKTGEEKKIFGTDRTFTFIGILGYILYIVQPTNLSYFIAGGATISVLLSIFYYNKLKNADGYGFTSILVALITYCLAPLIVTKSPVIYISIVVIVIIFTELKESFVEITAKFDKDEFITLGKFLAIAGVILPIIPDTPISPELNLTPYKIWLAVVVISSISYLSYILKKFVFKNSGILISGVLGGLYSSTATTFILARKSKEAKTSGIHYVSAIIMATAMMYVRILIIMYIFNPELTFILLPYFLILIVLSIAVSIIILLKNKNNEDETENFEGDKNPLEFKSAIIFTLLFVTFTIITNYTVAKFGAKGLNILSLFVGMTDIDPFLINLFQGKHLINITLSTISVATLQAIISNNILKAVYATIFTKNKLKKHVIIGFSTIISVNIILAIIASNIN